MSLKKSVFYPCNHPDCQKPITQKEIENGRIFVIKLNGNTTHIHKSCANRVLQAIELPKAKSSEDLYITLKEAVNSMLGITIENKGIVKRFMRLGGAVEKIFGKVNPFFGKK